MYLTSPNGQSYLKYIDTIVCDTVQPVSINVSSPLQVEFFTKYLSLMPN